MSIYLSLILQKPLLIEGPAGVGKTEIAKVMSRILETDLIRLQCYEGLDAHQAIYEWNHQKQLMYLQMSSEEKLTLEQKEKQIYSDGFLLKRPLLQSIMHEKKQVLLIDELDRSDEEFESYFLELLSDWQISIPEIGTLEAKTIPFVVVTSNRTREISEALRRRCLYLWIDYPDYDKELNILMHKLPDLNKELAEQITQFMQMLRKQKLDKLPGIAETIDWATALSAMHIKFLDQKLVEDTLGIVLKDWQDIRETQLSLSELLEQVGVKSKLH
jgi:MoxR-like ATPase